MVTVPTHPVLVAYMVLDVKPKADKHEEPDVAAELTVNPLGNVRVSVPVDVPVSVKVRSMVDVAETLVRLRFRLFELVRPATVKLVVSVSDRAAPLYETTVTECEPDASAPASYIQLDGVDTGLKVQVFTRLAGAVPSRYISVEDTPTASVATAVITMFWPISSTLGLKVTALLTGGVLGFATVLKNTEPVLPARAPAQPVAAVAVPDEYVSTAAYTAIRPPPPQPAFAEAPAPPSAVRFAVMVMVGASKKIEPPEPPPSSIELPAAPETRMFAPIVKEPLVETRRIEPPP
jgi:hypothetical protein